jgi:hypothetical protein
MPVRTLPYTAWSLAARGPGPAVRGCYPASRPSVAGDPPLPCAAPPTIQEKHRHQLQAGAPSSLRAITVSRGHEGRGAGGSAAWCWRQRYYATRRRLYRALQQPVRVSLQHGRLSTLGKYFGLQAGHACFCGNSYGSMGKPPQSYCNSSCQADPKEIRGGPSMNSVYETVPIM